LSSGEVDLDPDLWYLPREQGCHDIDIAWDPHANVVEPPLASLEITSPFGYRRHPILGGTRLHTGTDFDADTGDPVFASSPGVVVVASARGGYGQMVEIRHIGGLNTRYAHLSSISVTVGDQIETGHVVGAVGCTGLCTGPHLHFETLEFGEAVDPMSHLIGG
jgi:murein DD-endopeptidase MepM/ murein hydrolase activator NlpD